MIEIALQKAFAFFTLVEGLFFLSSKFTLAYVAGFWKGKGKRIRDRARGKYVFIVFI